MPNLRLIGLIGAALLLTGLVGWAKYEQHQRHRVEAKYDSLVEMAGNILFAIRNATDNPELTIKGAAGQVVALGTAHKQVKFALEQQNLTIDQMAREAIRLRAHARELREIADRARAQRAAALEKLSDMAITPGTREDCLVLLREAEDALDLVREAGL